MVGGGNIRSKGGDAVIGIQSTADLFKELRELWSETLNGYPMLLLLLLMLRLLLQ